MITDTCLKDTRKLYNLQIYVNQLLFAETLGIKTMPETEIQTSEAETTF